MIVNLRFVNLVERQVSTDKDEGRGREVQEAIGLVFRQDNVGPGAV